MSPDCAVNNPCSHRQELLLARHGETADNTAQLIIGRRNPPLSEAGHRQAAMLARAARDAGIVALWTSPLTRARQTAAVVGELVGLDAAVLPGLIESDRGAWEGERTELIAERSASLFEAFVTAQTGFAFPGGESLREQVRRTCDALDVIAAGPSPALAVAHAGTIRAALIALGRPTPPERALAHGEIMTVAWRASPSEPLLPAC